MPGDAFRTIGAPAEEEPPKVKGSRFIGNAYPVASEAEVGERLAAVRARWPGATHYCWAFRLRADGSNFRYSDDGEPGGSAGAPILRTIEGRDLTNALVVVTRYYGGTKLGTGGLIRAYGDAAAAALDAAPVVEHVRQRRLRLRFAYDDTAPAMQTLHRFDAALAEQHYTDVTELVVAVPHSAAEALAEAFTEALGGRGSVEPLGEAYAPR